MRQPDSNGSLAEEQRQREIARDALLTRLAVDAAFRLDESIDLVETIDAAAELAIPDLADWCLIDLVEPDGSLRRVAAVCGNAADRATLDAIRAFPTPAGSSRPAARAVRTRRPILMEDLRDPLALRRSTGEIDELASIIRAMQARSAVVQPLIARGKAIGAMFFVVGPH